MDLVENSISAKSTLIKIIIELNDNKNILKIRIEDNGKGIEKDKLNLILSPFYTTKQEREKKVGLGLPLFKMNALLTGGNFNIFSEPGKGTIVEAIFVKDNIDRQPLGKLYDTIFTLIIGHEDINFYIKISNNEKEFIIDTKVIKDELQGISLSNPDVINFLKDYIKNGLEEINLNCEKIY
ncbi:MAG: ATP-binding protein [Spirochaetes bacterium]|nr:ATP-binding protein [Spirochaetota bacterium]